MVKRILYVVNDVGFFLSHRLPVAERAQAEGYQVYVAAPYSPAATTLAEKRITFIPLRMNRNGRNPFSELRSIYAMIRVFRFVRPNILHLVTIKPVLYGSIAAYFIAPTALVAAISGLGPALSGRKRSFITTFAAKILYKIAFLHRRQRVIFQNSDDQRVLQSITGLEDKKCVLIRGSGVNLSEYRVANEPAGIPKVLMASRLLRDKGVLDFVAAARILRDRQVNVDFVLAGDPDYGSIGSISESEISKWRDEGIVTILGQRDDMARLIADCALVVLPSTYGEGLPKVLVEAAACGRAIVTTDHPGCRDAILPGRSGVLVPPHDVKALANSIQRLVEDPKLRQAMGREGRKLAEAEFAIDRIVDEQLSIYRELLC